MRIKRTDAVIPKNTFHNYGIDALRIISMLMIVTHHVLSHGGILKSSESTNYWSAWLIEISVICAVNCYALISGYVGIYTKYKISNLAFLWCRVVFYAICITIVCKCLFPSTVSIRAIISSFIPIVSGEYWYFTAYALLFLFIPILNEGLNRLSKRKLTFLLISVIIVVSVIQPFACIIWTDISYLSEGYSTWWLMILYLIGGYIRKYGFFINRPTKTWVYTTVYLAFVFATWV